MKKSIQLIALLTTVLSTIQVSAQQLHKLSFKSAAAMHTYFSYEAGKKIISGHRGTMEDGLPENSIPAFEAVLKKTVAIFEIDPRYTKDSIAVMIHDDTLDRTTTGKGKVSDYTWAELQKLQLRDHAGNITPYRINTLEEVIKWAKGKTILNLDKKDIPIEKTAALLKKLNAYAWVWVTVHNVDQARYYLGQHQDQYLSMHLKNKEALEKFEQSGLPYNRMIVYIGSAIKDSNQDMYSFLHKRGVMCMISSAPSYDKLSVKSERAAKYKAVFEDGASILESDLPMEVEEAIK